ncbi:hypothetical protein [Cognataquiflexum rubidum]|uniref:hypothetical protein n=1 Tax=Cognataquiflexum rubidum TaxID=2922273 RepID=UPI001F1326A7|nr:hypothetical protein [Cognataquiflexum rubidum]MCH6235810.1 hypothetical protein [Cognataquiflexum rubidum]
MKNKELFKPEISEDKLCEKFLLLRDNSKYLPAKQLIEQTFSLMGDQDGNFIKDFQSENGFYNRLWELYLFNVFVECRFVIESGNQYPDFQISQKEETVFVEAVTANSSPEDLLTDELIDEGKNSTDIEKKEETQSDTIDQYVIRLNSALRSKRDKVYKDEKRYWELDWVKGNPFVLAIEPCFNKYSFFFPDYKITELLYGQGYETKVDSENRLIGQKINVQEYSYKYKKTLIPSGFFNQKDSENISAVIFSNLGNIDKFNRMALQYKPTNEIFAVRSGLCYNSEEDSLAKDFSYQVGDGTHIEDWKEGVSIFHNPNAEIKLNRNLFKGCKQIWIEENEFKGEIPEFYPYNSITGTIKKDEIIHHLEKEELIKSTSEDDLRKLLSDDKLNSIVFGTNE